MAKHHKYRVITHIPETAEWEDQELVSGVEWDAHWEALAEMDIPIQGGYPPGTERYIEVTSYTDWERL